MKTNSTNHKRRTGRTTRMLDRAFAEAYKGRAVYVIAANEQDAHRLRVELGPLSEGRGIKIETPESLGSFDWQTMTLRGAHPNCLVLVDHYAIEFRFARMLAELTRYDVGGERTGIDRPPRAY